MEAEKEEATRNYERSSATFNDLNAFMERVQVLLRERGGEIPVAPREIDVVPVLVGGGLITLAGKRLP